MNILVSALRQHPEAVDRLAQGERVALEGVLDVLGELDSPFVLDQDMLDDLVRGQPLGRLLVEAYLAVVPRDRWRAQIERAQPPLAPEQNPFALTEWATLASSATSSQGVSLPDDDDPASPRLSFFAQDGAGLQRVSVDYTQGAEFPPTGLSVSLPNGCSLPNWGDCDPEECSGACALTRVVSDPDGLLCICPYGAT